ncbi:MAG: hypothetical protein JJ956_01810, partial [Pseudomonadales bacterium]|nr:hypothetical protein [Pseudomonadales bacterium]
SPVLVPKIDGVDIAPFDEVGGFGIALNLDVQQSTPGQPFYTGSFDLPVSAGQDENGDPNAEILSFSFSAIDDLGNQGTEIQGQGEFQVYQGDLPPLAVPFGLEGVALAGGQISLTWESVEGAAAYRLYRQAPGETELTLLTEISQVPEPSYVDGTIQALTDGTYQYSVSSLRTANNQEGESAQSESITISADATAPGQPTALGLELTSFGIRAIWTAPANDAEGNPEADELEYRLYRLALPEGQEANVDVAGLTPVREGITTAEVYDSSPSTSERMYAITAVDPSGNESVPSLGAYLNFELLPVANLKVDVPQDGLPTLSWTHDAVSLDGFDVYNVTGAPQKLNSGFVTVESYVDGSYNGGTGVDGVPIERTYRVIAVDNTGSESLAHDIVLPAVSAELISGQTLYRGIMNALRFRVDNLGASNAEDLVLTVELDDDGTTRSHQSPSFDVSAGDFAEVTVVVGGYPSLVSLTALDLRLTQVPNPGDEVTIRQQSDVEVGESGIVTRLFTEDFTRGATGDARISIENTSDVTIEVITARGNGQNASDEVRLVLADEDDNVLNIAEVSQATGTGVITLADGTSVARIAAGATWESNPISMSVPSASPEDVFLNLELDAFHYQLNQPTSVTMPGTGTTRALQLIETDYYGQLVSITPTSVFGDEIVTIEGTARLRDTNELLPYANLKIVLSVEGFERSYPLYANENGEFKFQYQPDDLNGIHTVSVLHPSIQDRPNDGQFTVSGAGVSPTDHSQQLPRNYEQTVDVRVTAGAATTLTNTRLEFVQDGSGGPLPSGITLSVSEPITLEEKETGFLKVTFSGDNSADATGELLFNVVTDTLPEPIDTYTLRYTLVEVGPALFPTPTIIETGVARENTVVETVVFENRGLDTLINGQVALVDPGGGIVPDWIQLATLPDIGEVGIGGEVEVQVRFSPPDTTAEANYLYELHVTGDNMATVELPLFAAVTQSGVGNAFFHASDIYTATLDENGVPIPGLEGVKVELQNELVLSEVFDATTDANGEVTFTDIPAGRYVYRATAFDHESAGGRITVKPGVTVAEDVFLFNQLVSVSFSVKEITLEDRYEIVIDATFETDVPVAVVALEPMVVNLPTMSKGDVFFGEMTLTNHGLIRAYDVFPTLPDDTSLASFELLVDVPETLEAGESVTLPYRVLALDDFDPGVDGDSSGGSCNTSNQTFLIVNSCECSNGVIVEGTTQVQVTYSGQSCSSNNVSSNFYNPSTSSSSTPSGTNFTPTPVTQPVSLDTGGGFYCEAIGDDADGDDLELFGDDDEDCP